MGRSSPGGRHSSFSCPPRAIPKGLVDKGTGRAAIGRRPSRPRRKASSTGLTPEPLHPPQTHLRVLLKRRYCWGTEARLLVHSCASAHTAINRPGWDQPVRGAGYEPFNSLTSLLGEPMTPPEVDAYTNMYAFNKMFLSLCYTSHRKR